MAGVIDFPDIERFYFSISVCGAFVNFFFAPVFLCFFFFCVIVSVYCAAIAGLAPIQKGVIERNLPKRYLWV